MTPLFPRSFDNAYRGARLAFVILGAVALLKLVIGTNTFFNTRFVVAAADGLPFSSYGDQAGNMILDLYQVWGLSQILLALLCVLALIRYRTMAPLLLLVLLTEQLGRKAAFMDHTVARAADVTLVLGVVPFPEFVNYSLTGALALAFLLSLVPRRGRTR